MDDRPPYPSEVDDDPLDTSEEEFDKEIVAVEREHYEDLLRKSGPVEPVREELKSHYDERSSRDISTKAKQAREAQITQTKRKVERPIDTEINEKITNQINRRVIAPIVFGTGVLMGIGSIGATLSGNYIVGVLAIIGPILAGRYLYLSRNI